MRESSVAFQVFVGAAPFFGAVLLLAGVIWRSRSQDAKNISEAASEIVKSYGSAFSDQQIKIGIMEKRVESLELVIERLRERISILEQENKELKSENRDLRRQFEAATGGPPNTEVLG